MSEKQAKIIYLSVGSNLGNRKKNIEKTKFELYSKGINIIRSSNYYETLSWPNPKNPKFYNIILKVSSDLKILELLKICKQIETSLGRKKAPKNSPRTCDIDIIDYNQKITVNGINVPHPRMHLRNFVLIPLFEIEKNWRYPNSERYIKNLIFSLSNSDIRSIKLV
jgi:2-amino-4-hydroxy-6-hydroxymethyldihydropteridine diphosphokinase